MKDLSIYHQFEANCRRLRASLKNSKVKPISPELAFHLFTQYSSEVDLKIINNNIEKILNRNGNAGNYLLMLIEPLQEKLAAQNVHPIQISMETSTQSIENVASSF
ncbi:hypothetical protein [Peribacillus sp. SCS-155]|uniref:hypothetical protein n=1 Tax=Peribacillus sedimenti TaxID=3115297 RepID=UPI0039063C62